MRQRGEKGGERNSSSFWRKGSREEKRSKKRGYTREKEEGERERIKKNAKNAKRKGREIKREKRGNNY